VRDFVEAAFEVDADDHAQELTRAHRRLVGALPLQRLGVAWFRRRGAPDRTPVVGHGRSL